MKNKMKYPILKPLIFTLIMFFLIQPVKTTQIFTATCKNCAESSIFFKGQAKMMKDEVLNLEKRYFYTNQILFYHLLLLSMISSIKKKKTKKKHRVEPAYVCMQKISEYPIVWECKQNAKNEAANSSALL